MIKGNGRPDSNHMTSNTIRAKLAFVWRIFSVAANAGGRGAFVGTACMATATFQPVMSRRQREKVVIHRAFWKGNIERVVQVVGDVEFFISLGFWHGFS